MPSGLREHPYSRPALSVVSAWCHPAIHPGFASSPHLGTLPVDRIGDALPMGCNLRRSGGSYMCHKSWVRDASRWREGTGRGAGSFAAGARVVRRACASRIALG